MFKKIVKSVVYNRIVAKPLLKLVLYIHTFCYDTSGKLAAYVNGGIHPKHNILKYKEWFLSNINPEDCVIDVGCNTGSMPRLLSQKARYVYGIEIEQKHIDVALLLPSESNVEFICGDATCFDYSQCEPVDVLTLSNVLEHIELRAEFLQDLIGNVSWRTSSRKLLIRVPMIDREWIVPYKKELGVRWKLDETHYTEYTFEQFKKELDQAKIRIESYYIRFGEIYAVCYV